MQKRRFRPGPLSRPLLCTALAASLAALACDERVVLRASPATASTGSSSLISALFDPVSSGPVRVQALDPKAAQPVFVLLGPAGSHKLVFLHGMCGHGHGYAQSFQHAAARRGRLIAPQADVLCGGGPWAKWSMDLEKLDQRIVQTFEALGAKPPFEDIAVLGYSQGATRAEALARRYPQRYTRLVLMGAPSVTSAQGLGSLKSAVMMAGERDRQDKMKAGQRNLQAAKIPVTFLVLPGATHGAMGTEPEKTMDAALEFLFTNTREVAKPAADAGAK